MVLQFHQRKRTRANFAASTTQRPQPSTTQPHQDIFPQIPQDKFKPPHTPVHSGTNHSISKQAISALSLAQLQNLSALVAERIHIKKRYNNTPLRRIITRQSPTDQSRKVHMPSCDSTSETDTVMHTEPPKVLKDDEGVIKARWNNTPLRRILSRQLDAARAGAQGDPASTAGECEVERLVGRRARCNNIPLRCVRSGRMCTTSTCHAKIDDYVVLRCEAAVSDDIERDRETELVSRSNTPLRRVLERQVGTQAVVRRGDAEEERADSVVDSGSPTGLRSVRGDSGVVVELERDAWV